MKFSIIEYKIKSDFPNCDIDISNDGTKWRTIHRGMNEYGQNQILEFANSSVFSYLKITNTCFEPFLNYFNMFGSLHFDKSSFDLKKLVKLSKPALNVNSRYSFSMNEKFGLISFLMTFSPKQVFENFFICDDPHSIDSSVFKAFQNDQLFWISNNENEFDNYNRF